MDTSTLSIILKAVDLASADIEAVRAQISALGDTAVESAAKTDAAADATKKQGSAFAGLGGAAAIAVAGVALVAGATVKMAGDFQQSIERLVTSAGESQSNVKMISDGILQIANSTGTSTTALSTAMYMIESGGQHGAAGLAVLTAAAQGAKTENADLTTVADAVTSAMTDYHLSASQAATVTSKLVAATGQGKTTFNDLAGAMSAILPKASAAGISLNEILGDLASMTEHGISAQQAAENMADAISHMQNPTQQMSKELASLGLNSTALSQNLGKEGLSGTFDEISSAIEKDMGTGTTAVILNMQNALKGLPASVQSVSQEVINGSATWAQWNVATKGLTVTQKAQADQFASLYNGMHAIGTAQMTGAQVMQTYAGAMAKATGDSASLNVALMLSGQNSTTTSKAISAVTGATAEAGNNVKGWSVIQGEFNQQLSQTWEALQTTAITIGQTLMPVATVLLGWVKDILVPMANFAAAHRTITTVIFLAVAAVLAMITGLTLLAKITKTVSESSAELGLVEKAQAIGEGLVTAATFAVTAAQWLWNAAMDANPIGLIIIAIAALILIVIALTDKWRVVADFFVGLWKDLYNVFNGGTGLILTALFPFIGIPIEIMHHWTQIVDFYKDMWGKIMNSFHGGIGIIITLVAPMIGIPLEIIDHWKAIVDFFKNAWDNPRQTWQNFTNGVASDWDKLSSKSEQWGGDLVRDIGKGIKDPALIITGLKDLIEAVANQEAKWAVDAWDLGKRLVTEIGHGMALAISDLEGDFKSLLQRVENDASNWTTDAKNLGSSIAKKVGNGISDATSTVNDAFSGMMANVKRNAPKWGSDIVNGIKAGFKDLWNWDVSQLIDWKRGLTNSIAPAGNFAKGLVKDITDGWNNAWKGIGNWWTSVTNSISSGYKSAKSGIAQFGKNMVSDIVSGFKGAVKDIGKAFEGIPGAIAGSLKKSGQDTAQKHIDGAADTFGDVGKMKKIGDAILKGLGEAIGVILIAIGILALSLAIALINGLINGIKEELKLIGQALTLVNNTIVGFFKDAGTWLYDVGKSIIQGMINGIGSMGNAAGSAVKGVASNAVSSIKNFLGIKSPSTVFAEIGANVGAGLVQGISGTTGAVNRAVVGLVPTQVNGMTVGAGGSILTPTALVNQRQTALGSANAGSVNNNSSSSNATNVTLNVNVGAYMGQPGELNNLAVTLHQAMAQVARQHGLASQWPSIGTPIQG